MSCGATGGYREHLKVVETVIGRAPGVRRLSAISLIILQSGSYFLCDTYVTVDPSADDLFEMTTMAAAEVRRFGIEPKVALLSHSIFGTADLPRSASRRVGTECVSTCSSRGWPFPIKNKTHD